MNSEGKLYLGVGSLSYDNFLPLDVFGLEYDELRNFLRSRSVTGVVNEVDYGTKRGFKIELDYIPSSIAAIINSYWYSRAELEVSTDLDKKNFTPSVALFQPSDNLLTDPHFLNLAMNGQIPRNGAMYSAAAIRQPYIFQPNNPFGQWSLVTPAALIDVRSSHTGTFPICVASRFGDDTLTAKTAVMVLEMKSIGFRSGTFASLDFISHPNGSVVFNGTGIAFMSSYAAGYKTAASISPVTSLLGETTNLVGAISVDSYNSNVGEIYIRRAFITLTDSTFSLPSSVYYGDFVYTSSIGSTSRRMYIANDNMPLRNTRAFSNDQFFGVIELREF